MAIVLTDGSNNVTFDVVKNVVPVVVKNLEMVETSSGTVPMDKGRVSDGIRLNGTLYTSGYTDINQLNGFMDARSEVTLSGMDDTNHNCGYFIRALSFSSDAGFPSDMYDFSIDLEKARD